MTTAGAPVHARITARLLGRELTFLVHPGLFSADRVDDGTRLLLDHLPEGAPARVLDLGCGYGALGLPIAAAHPTAQLLLLDRDVLAVEDARANAARNALDNVTALPSLGYGVLEERADAGPFDWILCNVPARIGAAAIAQFLGRGMALLAPGGALRVVVINDLVAPTLAVCEGRSWPVRRVAEGARHAILACPAHPTGIAHDEAIYRRDVVQLGGRDFDRPHDVNEDVNHLREGVPLLLDCLPRKAESALCWRAGYGPVAAALLERCGQVTAVDRDLLALRYARRNAGERLALHPATALDGLRAPLVVGELVGSAGHAALTAQLEQSVVAAGPGGQALWLGLSRLLKELSAPIGRLRGFTVASRGRYGVVRLPGR